MDFLSNKTLHFLFPKLELLNFYTDRRCCSSCYSKENSGKPPPDECLLSDLKLKNNQKIMMMGTREEVITEVSLTFINFKCNIRFTRAAS